MWELDYKESWVLKNWTFELWCWRRLLRVPWIARRFNHSILKEISPEYSLEGLKLKLQCFDHLYEELIHWKSPWSWKDWRQEEKGMTEDEMVGWHHRLNGHEFEQAPRVGDGYGSLSFYSHLPKISPVTAQFWSLSSSPFAIPAYSFCNKNRIVS